MIAFRPYWKSNALVGILLAIASASCSRSTGKPETTGSAKPVPTTSGQTSTPPTAPQAALVVIQSPPAAQPAADAERPDRILENGHSSAVTALAFSPDGHWMATGG